MQNRYSGDIGDFSKFSLLRSLFSHPEYRIGLVWYLYPDESHNDDGRHIDYLKKAKYGSCDKQLIKQLSRIVNNHRSVKFLEQAQVLPENTIYFSEYVDFFVQYPGSRIQDRQLRKEAREQWLNKALQALSDSNVVVLDPDNGIEIKSIPNTHQKKSGKYAYYSEIEQFFTNHAVCVIYHHFDRSSSHANQIKAVARDLKNKINFSGSVFALRFSPYSPRAYFLLVKHEAVDFLRSQIQNFLNSDCGFAWDALYET